MTNDGRGQHERQYVCKTGHAKIIVDFDLLRCYVSHTIGPSYNMTLTEGALYYSYRNAADLAYCFICRTTMQACKAGNTKAEGGFITVGLNNWRDRPMNVDGVYRDGALLVCHLCVPQCSEEAAPPTGWIPVGNLQHLHHLLQDNDDDDEL
ncbi:hypothetical protein MAR_017834 [Mya arenaria]|uniref:Uncharacterized protein n=1 Tax=Mya arenaria TaxID=6604 RepID=A0ABY7EGF0_MYAAR|nr:hypothetical protein MAR_017834 [Mya arenaria]